MRNEDSEKAARMRKLLMKLTELAEVLDDITLKMKILAEKQKKFSQRQKKGLPPSKKALPSPEPQKKAEKPPFLQFPVNNFQVFMVKKNRPAKQQKKASATPPGKMSFKEYIEFTTFEEFLKFKKMGPITKADLEKLDFENLSKRLFPK